MTSRRVRRLALLAAVALGAGAAATGAAVPAAAEVQDPELTFARMAGALIGGGAPALTPEERSRLDAEGNRNQQYDIGDVRRMLYYHPELVPAGTVRTAVSPR